MLYSGVLPPPRTKTAEKKGFSRENGAIYVPIDTIIPQKREKVKRRDEKFYQFKENFDFYRWKDILGKSGKKL